MSITAWAFARIGNWLTQRQLSRALCESLTRSEASRFRRALRTERRRLSSLDEDLLRDAAARWHRGMTSYVLAAHRALVSLPRSREEATRRVESALLASATSTTPYVRGALDRSRDPFRELVRISKKKEDRYYGASFDFARVTDTDNIYHLHVKRCFYNDYFRRHDAPELAAAFCELDRAWTDAIDPGAHRVRFQRPATLAKHGEPCRFEFDREGAP